MSTQLTERERRDVRGRSNGVCEVCGQRRAEQMHHRQPRGMGGTSQRRRHHLENILDVCGRCHMKIESNRTVAEFNGWLVPAGMDPGQMPVYLRIPWAGWFMLGDSTIPLPTHPVVAVQIESID